MYTHTEHITAQHVWLGNIEVKWSEMELRRIACVCVCVEWNDYDDEMVMMSKKIERLSRSFVFCYYYSTKVLIISKSTAMPCGMAFMYSMCVIYWWWYTRKIIRKFYRCVGYVYILNRIEKIALLNSVDLISTLGFGNNIQWNVVKYEKFASLSLSLTCLSSLWFDFVVVIIVVVADSALEGLRSWGGGGAGAFHAHFSWNDLVENGILQE